jgi:large subunit ribosomal protein L21
MYAVIRVAGTQHIVREGDSVLVPHHDAEPGTALAFTEVLALRTDDDLVVGRPLVSDARVEAEVIDHPRHRKVTTMKFIRRENYRRRKGHRQEMTRVRITGIKPA